MRLEAACRPIFARHETFHPRFGWIKKAHDGAAADANLFNDENAVVALGVGKNMVKSIRHWGLASRVITRAPGSSTRNPDLVPSAIGNILFADDGWDPYCELPGTLWLLHWWLLAPPSAVPVWWLAFGEFTGLDFTEEQLRQFVGDRIRGWSDPHPSAITKDISCLLRMYAPSHSSRATFDELIDCPFRELDLIRQGADDDAFRFVQGPKPTLPAPVAAFACLDFVARTDPRSRTATVSRLTTEPGSPGRAFKLTEATLVSLLEEAAQEGRAIEITSSAGIPQLIFPDDPAVVATELLYDYYRTLIRDLRYPRGLLLAGPYADGPARARPLDVMAR